MPLNMYEEKKPSGLSRVKNVLAVAAGKGGVGKSTVTVLLAQALHRQGFRVGVMDADVYGPSIRRMLPEDRIPSQKGQIFIPGMCGGIRMISMAYFRKENEAAAVRAPIANGIITQFINQVDWEDLDYLLIDFPPGTGDIQLTLSQQAALTGAVMVTTPQEVAAMDVRKAIHLFMQVHVPLVGIVENMSFYLSPQTNEKVYLFGKGGGERLAEEYGIPFLGQIPIDPEISRCGDNGQSIFQQLPVESSLIQALDHTVKQILKQTDKLKEKKKEGKEELVKTIHQKDPHTFTVEWIDGTKSDYRLSDLQKECPCANCVDEATGQRRLDPATVNEDVKASTIRPVGRYALKIQFTSGCSHGIYTFEYLRALRK